MAVQPSSERALLVGLPAEFQQLPDALRDELSRHGQLHALARNKVLIPFGTSRPPVVAVRTGLMAISHPTRRERLVITDFLRVQEVFFASLTGEDVADYELRSVAPANVVTWPAHVFRQVAFASAPFSRWLVERINRRLHAQYYRQARLTAPLDQQMAYLLWTLADTELSDGRRLLNIKVPQADIASYLGITREEVSRKKQVLEKAGYLSDTETGLELSYELPQLFSPQSGVTSPWGEEGPAAATMPMPL